MKLFIKILIFLVLFSSCEKEKRSEYLKSYSPPEMEIAEDASVVYEMNARLPSKKQQKIIKTSFLSFETDSIEKTYASIKQEVEKLDGFIQSDNTTKEYNQIRRSVIVKIPSKNFQTVIDHIANEIKIFDKKSISLKDVSEEFIDLEARLKAKKALEERYLQLLKKAKNVKEMLEIEREIANIREEIEAKQGRLNYLKNQVSYSTIHLEFYETIPVVQSKSKTYFSKVLQAFKGGFETLGNFILGLLYIWPFVIIMVVALFYIRKRIKKRRKNK